MPTIAGASRKQAGKYYDKGGAVFNIAHPDFGALGGANNDTAAVALCMAAIGAAGGGIMEIPAGSWTFDPPALVANCTVRGAGKGRTIISAATINGQWLATDVSNLILERFTFIGKSAAGTATTNNAVLIKAVTVDVSNVDVRDCEFKDFKADAAIRVGGNGDLLTVATFLVRDLRIERNKISQYYDINPALIGQIAAGIYLFGGVTDAWVERNTIDGTSGKQGILVQTEGLRIWVRSNSVKNCGLTNNSDGSYGIAIYSSYVAAVISEVDVAFNKISWSARAGIYLAGIRDYGVDNNILFQPDQGSTGLGTVGAGGIHINNGVDDARNGNGSVNNNKIYDPGFAAINLGLGTFQRAEMSCVGNICKMLTAGLSRFGYVVNGRGATITGGTIRGFTKSIFIYNAVADDTGDLTFGDIGIDATGAAASTIGITVNSTVLRFGPVNVNNLRFKGCVTGMDIRPVSGITASKCHFFGANTSAIIQGIEDGSISGFVSDGGTSGLSVALKAATANARCTLRDNIMGKNLNPCVVTENTGQIIIGQGNDFGTQPGVSADQGDASVASAINQPAFEIFKWSTTLTANRSATQAATKCFRGDRRRFVRDAAVPGAFTFAVIDGASAATLYTIAASTKGWVDIVFNGANWVLAGAGTFT